ncbi:hypothetical protein COT44_02645 [Candidatus Shapirobacteria bacterium CG08_land_8_20_14_0_20_39_18]|uniref:Uncharacterized protein n=1 Tax=Candidatus Shapirobacteria bacterium CG08_land_8_20_14_0_20_39_18 TaxID=1974883 RepID=A0A2M6XD30_9BACT|nr:MAG: hypothetical protein COT44_02645 [Candidatus Shapirobacteria bacterium CG08_land_8_20_14_0_20_39_18]PIY65294.1 MAG: hypothetical protein COY91_02665 [Candidatus Shapirobacteria bacterium CG_4_10_14_0_8_um_filter_39_15]PJE68369.1 MAG: hypothetical protein COU94_02190 [Candidatus Shapirobacteria bacterium CG10_big_fil_rev_8_21_14_0_10_38_8]
MAGPRDTDKDDDRNDDRDDDKGNDKDDSWPSGYDYIDSSGSLHDNARETIEANLSKEEAWGTGAQCSQDADNIDSSDSKDD